LHKRSQAKRRRARQRIQTILDLSQILRAVHHAIAAAVVVAAVAASQMALRVKRVPLMAKMVQKIPKRSQMLMAPHIVVAAAVAQPVMELLQVRSSMRMA
jgi:hypothetical protein